MKTYIPKESEIKKGWFIVDAKDKVLGRLASRVACVLTGKGKPIFCRHIDTGDQVIVINAAHIRLTGRKTQQKVYRRYSGYPGGLREVSFEKMFKAKPETVVMLAVGRMLPQNPLGRKMLKKLKVYSGAEHPHLAQQPLPLEI
jgi:large subunit ribosomal protein L13